MKACLKRETYALFGNREDGTDWVEFTLISYNDRYELNFRRFNEAEGFWHMPRPQFQRPAAITAWLAALDPTLRALPALLQPRDLHDQPPATILMPRELDLQLEPTFRRAAVDTPLDAASEQSLAWQEWVIMSKGGASCAPTARSGSPAASSAGEPPAAPGQRPAALDPPLGASPPARRGGDPIGSRPLAALGDSPAATDGDEQPPAPDQRTSALDPPLDVPPANQPATHDEDDPPAAA